MGMKERIETQKKLLEDKKKDQSKEAEIEQLKKGNAKLKTALEEKNQRLDDE